MTRQPFMRFAPRFLLILALGCGFAHAEDGKLVYETHCANCHQPDGAGALGLAPPLAGTLGKRMASPAGRQYLGNIVISGLAGKIESKGVIYDGMMPSWAQLSDQELAAVINYVLTQFNAAELPADHQPFTPEVFANARAKKMSGKELRALRVASQ